MVIVQFLHNDKVIKVHPVPNAEFTEKDFENIEADIKRGIIPKPKYYDKYELYEGVQGLQMR